jgi:two-component sensor histidine kinase
MAIQLSNEQIKVMGILVFRPVAQILGLLSLIIIQSLQTTVAQAFQSAVASAPEKAPSSQEALRTYSTAQKRLLAINTAIFINEITQFHLDADSIQLVASRITGLPFLLPYTERIEGDNISPTAELINHNNIIAAKKLSKQLKGENQIRSLINLATWYLHQPKAFRSDLDSAEHYIKEANTLIAAGDQKKWVDECVLITGEIQYQRGKIDESRKYFLSIIAPAYRGKETAVVAEALHQLSKTFSSPDIIRLQYLKRSADIYHRLHLVENEITLRWLIGDYYLANQQNLAKDIFLQILALQRSSGFKHELFTQYLLSAVYNNDSKLSEALKSAYAALENMKWSRLDQFRGCFNMRIGVVYSGINKPLLAIPWFSKGTAVKSDETHFFWYKSFLYHAAALYQIGKPYECLRLIDSTVNKYPPKTMWENIQVLSTQAVCYEALHKITLADLCYRKILASVKNYNDTYSELTETYADGALFYIRIDNSVMARSFLAKMNQNLAIDLIDKALKYNILYKIDSLEGNYNAALAHHVLFQQANDSLAAYDQQQQLNELTVKYASAKKDQDIKLLQEQQRVQQSELKKGKLIRNFIIAAGCLVALLLIVVVNRYQLKQRTSEQISRKNASLQHLLTEKEWLLKEVHHRVKNNLHTVICLLESQSRYLENDALQAIETSQQRIFAMSLIHQKLYQSDDIKTINMATYIPELVQSLIDGFGTAGQIHFNLDIEPIDLSLTHAIPLALIINEAVTNSIKYAFPQNSKGEILIAMNDAGKRITLILADNGVGMPQMDNDIEPESLGLRLIKGLSEDIDAEVRFEIKNGTKIIISFKPDPLKNIPSILTSTNLTEVAI